jgi:hypothetical protein
MTKRSSHAMLNADSRNASLKAQVILLWCDIVCCSHWLFNVRVPVALGMKRFGCVALMHHVWRVGQQNAPGNVAAANVVTSIQQNHTDTSNAS